MHKQFFKNLHLSKEGELNEEVSIQGSCGKEEGSCACDELPF
jgi:hypothetical protein